jgi:hypothetical protein
MAGRAAERSPEEYTLNSLRYDLSQLRGLRAKELVEKVPRFRRYQFTGQGYRLRFVYLKLFEKGAAHRWNDPPPFQR